MFYCYNNYLRFDYAPINVSPHSPPREESGLYGGFDLTSGQIPPDGGRILCSNPPVNRGFLSPKQLHTSKQVIKESLLSKARFKSPSMGPTFQVKLDQIPPYVRGGGGWGGGGGSAAL